jgi:hypothetical protein
MTLSNLSYTPFKKSKHTKEKKVKLSSSKRGEPP